MAFFNHILYNLFFNVAFPFFFSFFNALTLSELGTGYFQPLGSASPRFLLLSSYFLSLFAPRMRSLNFIIFVGLVFFFFLVANTGEIWRNRNFVRFDNGQTPAALRVISIGLALWQWYLLVH